MGVPPSGRRGKYEERPEPCLWCGSASWWNGFRHVAQTILDAAGGLARVFLTRRRSRCSSHDCSGPRDATVYEPTGYPHRWYQLPVTAAAVGDVVFGEGKALGKVAEEYGCDRRSVGRWLRWTARLAEPAELIRAIARLDPAGLPPPRVSSNPGIRARAGAVLALLDRFAEVLRQRGVPLLAVTPGLMAVLAHQLRRYGIVFYLTIESPPMHVSLEVLRI